MTKKADSQVEQFADAVAETLMDSKTGHLYINDEVIRTTWSMLCGHLTAHMDELEQAYIDSADSDEAASNLKVALAVQYKEEKGGVKITTSIRFAAKMITEKSETIAFPIQKPLEMRQRRTAA